MFTPSSLIGLGFIVPVLLIYNYFRISKIKKVKAIRRKLKLHRQRLQKKVLRGQNEMKSKARYFYRLRREKKVARLVKKADRAEKPERTSSSPK